MKSQALVVQFIIFFTIGLAFFLIAGNLFRFQSDLIKKDILDLSSELTSQHMSALIITSVDICKSCDSFSTTVDVKSIVGYNPEFKLASGILLSIEPENKILQSSIHNLHHSVTYETDEVSSTKPITLTYDRTENNLVIE